MAKSKQSWRRLRDGALAVLGLVVLGVAAFSWLHDPAEKPIRLRMTAGRTAGERGRLAEVLRREAARRKIALELIDTAGSEEALRKVDAGAIDVAFAQGGLDLGDRPNLRQVAALHIEPLHLLVKKEIHGDVAAHLSGLRGKVVNLGEPGSGTACLAPEVMAFAGLVAKNGAKAGDFIASAAGYDALLNEANYDRLPDAIFMVSSLPSPVAHHLASVHDYRLVPLPYFDAFTLDPLDPDPEPFAGEGEDGAVTKVRRGHVFDATIPPFTYGVEPGVPPTAIRTLGTRLLLVAHKDVSSDTIQRLLEVIFGTPSKRTGQALLDAKLLDLRPELPSHKGTIAFIRRNAPLIAEDAVDLFEKEVSIAAGLLGGLFFLGRWAFRRVRRHRDQGFQAYILRVHDIERRATVLEDSTRLDFAGLTALRREIAQLKGEALDQFAAGTLEGEELMSGFLAHVSDTRDYLERLILHERDKMERQAGPGNLDSSPISRDIGSTSPVS